MEHTIQDIPYKNYLREAGTVTIVRVGHVGGYTHVDPVGIVASGSLSGTNLVVEVVDNYLVHYLPRMVLNQLAFPSPTNSISCQLSSSTFNISGSELGIPVSTSVVPSSVVTYQMYLVTHLSEVKIMCTITSNKDKDSTGYFVESGSKVEFLSFDRNYWTLTLQAFNYSIYKITTYLSERHNLFRFHTCSWYWYEPRVQDINL